MKQISRFLCAALALLALGCLRVYAEPAEVCRSVAHLYAVKLDDAGKVRTRWTGTAFAVGIAGEASDIFLTNSHVITGGESYDPEKIRIWLLRDEAKFDEDKLPLSDCAVPCQILAVTDGFPDVAVIRAEVGYPALPLMSSNRVPNGTQVYAFGFPGLKGSRYGYDSGPEDVTVTEGAVREHLQMTAADNTRCLIHSASARHGNSGGPLVDSRGVVVGQNTYGFEADVTTELFCALYIDYGMELLDGLGIAYTVAPGSSRISVFIANALSRPQTGAVTLAILAIVLFLLMTIAELLRKSSAKR